MKNNNVKNSDVFDPFKDELEVSFWERPAVRYVFAVALLFALKSIEIENKALRRENRVVVMENKKLEEEVLKLRAQNQNFIHNDATRKDKKGPVFLWEPMMWEPPKNADDGPSDLGRAFKEPSSAPEKPAQNASDPQRNLDADLFFPSP